MNKTKPIWPDGPFSLPDEEQYEKQLKKQKIVRNEFPTTGKYNMPLIKKQNISISKIELWGISKAKSTKKKTEIKPSTFLLTIGFSKIPFQNPKRQWKS